MTETRVRHETVTFQNAFSLAGIDALQPAGCYALEIEERLVSELSFPAYVRTATVIRLSSAQPGRYEAAVIDPVDLEAALERDVLALSQSVAGSIGAGPGSGKASQVPARLSAMDAQARSPMRTAYRRCWPWFRSLLLPGSAPL